jgi:hypothetical protein
MKDRLDHFPLYTNREQAKLKRDYEYTGILNNTNGGLRRLPTILSSNHVLVVTRRNPVAQARKKPDSKISIFNSSPSAQRL